MSAPGFAPSPGAATIRRVYGRGFQDGLRSAGVATHGMPMNDKKAARLESSLNEVARKVLAVVPLQDAWTPGQVGAELKRLGSNIDPRVIMGCLDRLRGLGLVREPEAGRFVRVTVRAASGAVTPEEVDAADVELAATAEPEPEPAASPSPADPLELLGRLAGSLRGLADELEEAALLIEQRQEQASAETDKLRQLQALLKSFAA